jgi:hypothetical protein
MRRSQPPSRRWHPLRPPGQRLVTNQWSVRWWWTRKGATTTTATVTTYAYDQIDCFEQWLSAIEPSIDATT